MSTRTVDGPSRTRGGRPRRRVVVALLSLALLLAGCGSVDDGPASASPPDGSSSAFPVTLSQKPVAVTIAAEPRRVVALDVASADNALALGVVPVGIAKAYYVADGVTEWTTVGLGGSTPEIFDVENGYPFETIARLDPDVILATNAYPYLTEAGNWDKLSAIAPVVGNVEDPFVDTWQQSVTQVGTALGRSSQARQVIADVESRIAQARTDHPEFADKTITGFNYLGSDGLWAISSPEDFSVKFLMQLGFRGVPDTVAALAGGERRVRVSPERYRDLEADLLWGTSSVGQLDSLDGEPTFRAVSAVARGAYVRFPVEQSTSMVQPSALSLPFAVDTLVPRMAQALDGPGAGGR